MENQVETSEVEDFFHYVDYIREAPHPKFTALQLDYIRSIDRFLTPEEVDAVSRVESFRIRLGDGDVRCREVPGLRCNYGNTVVYIQRYSEEKFAIFMEKVMDKIAAEPQGANMFLRFIDPIRIVIQGIGIFYPLTYGVGAHGWRDRVRSRMAEVGALTGEFDNGKFILSNGGVLPVASMNIERNNCAGPGYSDGW